MVLIALVPDHCLSCTLMLIYGYCLTFSFSTVSGILCDISFI